MIRKSNIVCYQNIFSKSTMLLWCSLLIFAGILLVDLQQAHAASGSVAMTTMVVAKKPTDTINDFQMIDGGSFCKAGEDQNKTTPLTKLLSIFRNIFDSIV